MSDKEIKEIIRGSGPYEYTSRPLSKNVVDYILKKIAEKAL